MNTHYWTAAQRCWTRPDALVQLNQLSTQIRGYIGPASNVQFWTSAYLGRQKRIEREVETLRRQAATLFAEFNNWQLSERPFAPKMLAAQKAHRASRYYHGNWPAGVLHNPDWYRSAGRRASAVVSHDVSVGLPDGKSNRERISDWCRSEGLRVTFLDDLLSWWDPGRAVLTMIEPSRTSPGIRAFDP